MNYAELYDAILSTTENDDATFVATVDRFIQTAEHRIYSEIRVPETHKSAALTLTIGSRAAAIPADCIVVKDVVVNGVSLIPKSPGFITSMYPNVATQAAPKYYAIDGAASLQLAPTPNSAYASTISYTGYPTSIITANTTWLGDNFDQVLLYAALLEAYVFMKGDADIMAYYKTAYDAGIQELSKSVQNTRQEFFRER